MLQKDVHRALSEKSKLQNNIEYDLMFAIKTGKVSKQTKIQPSNKKIGRMYTKIITDIIPRN